MNPKWNSHNKRLTKKNENSNLESSAARKEKK